MLFHKISTKRAEKNTQTHRIHINRISAFIVWAGWRRLCGRGGGIFALHFLIVGTRQYATIAF